jgi:hypothetical protein
MFREQCGVYHTTNGHTRYGVVQPHEPNDRKIFCPENGRYYSLHQFALTHLIEYPGQIRTFTVNAWESVYVVAGGERIRIDTYYNRLRNEQDQEQ